MSKSREIITLKQLEFRYNRSVEPTLLKRLGDVAAVGRTSSGDIYYDVNKVADCMDNTIKPPQTLRMWSQDALEAMITKVAKAEVKRMRLNKERASEGIKQQNPSTSCACTRPGLAFDVVPDQDFSSRR